MPKKKKKELHFFSVPMRWTMRGHATVEASDADEAVAKCESGDCEMQDSTGEMVNWEVKGKAQLED